MRKNNSRVSFCLFFILLSLLLAEPVRIFGNWGLEVGRANESDNVRLLSDWLAMKMARNRIEKAMQLSGVREQQRAVLGLPANAAASPDVLLDGIYDWWLKDVLGPAKAISSNPAASCEEAQLATQTLLKMMGQRQILGLDGTDKRDQDMVEMLPAIAAQMFTRCRDEALDECVATGRIVQILYLMNAEGRQAQLLGGAVADVESWATDALKQCAIYELHFVSTTKVAMPTVETVRDGKVAIKFDPSAGGLTEATQPGRLGDFLNGQTKDSPFFVSIKCSLPPLDLTCSPGADSDPVRSRINYLDLKHREFYVDQNGISRERMAGEDKFSFEFAGGIFALKAVVKAPNFEHTVPFPGHGAAFYIAHKKHQLGEGPGQGTGVKVERNTRGAYPVIFQFTYADQNRVGGAGGADVSDSTEFQLIHKPEPKPFPARPPEPVRKPLKPRPG